MTPHCSESSLTAKEMKALKIKIGTRKLVHKHHAQNIYSVPEGVNLKH